MPRNRAFIILIVIAAILFGLVFLGILDPSLFQTSAWLDRAIGQPKPQAMLLEGLVSVNERTSYDPITKTGYIYFFGFASVPEIYSSGVRDIIKRYPKLEIADFEVQEGAGWFIIQFRDKK